METNAQREGAGTCAAGQTIRVRPAVDYRPLLDPPFRDPNLKPDAQAIHAFAVSNGWEYFVGTGAQSLPGIVFRDARGRSRKLQRAGNIVRLPGSPFIEVGNAAYSIAVNLNLMSLTWGYVALQLSAPLPPLVAESARARALSPLPSLPEGGVQVTLTEADSMVVVHTSPAAEEWVRTAFTARLVALLDDPRLPLNIEVADGWLFLYAPSELSTPDPAVWERAFSALGEVAAAFGANAGVPAAHSSSTQQTAPSTPAPSFVTTTPLASKEQSWRVGGRRVTVVYGAAFGIFALLATGLALFLPR
jgi:hypothetical protein